MKKIVSFLILFIIHLFVYADSSPNKMYLDIANSISSAQGNIQLTFSEGSWAKVFGTTKVIMDFSNDQKVNFQFAYAGGSLQDGSKMTFQPAIHLWVKPVSGPGFSLKISEFVYNNDGTWKDWKVDWDNDGTNNPNLLRTAQEALKISDLSENLFQGKLFTKFGDARPSTTNGVFLPGGKPFLKSLKIKKASETEPGLAVTFIQGSTIHFSARSSSMPYDNILQLDYGSFELRYLDYDVVTKNLDCEISKFDLNVKNGRFENADLNILLGLNSRVRFDRLKLIKDEINSEVNCERGALNVQVSGGTKFVLSKKSRLNSELVFNNGVINLYDFIYRNSSENETYFQFGSSSTLNVNVRSGRLALCNERGYLSFGPGGILEATLSGIWSSDTTPNNDDPDCHLVVQLLSVPLDGGRFPIGEDNIVGIKSGFIKSENLRFDATNFKNVVGEIKDLNIVLDNTSTFAVPGGLRFQINNGTIDGADPNNPLKFDTKGENLSGLFKFNLNFLTFSNGITNVIKLNNGKLKMDLHVIDKDNLSGDRIYVAGNSTLTALNTDFGCNLEFSDEQNPSGVFSYTKGNQPAFSSTLKFQLSQSNAISLTSPFIKVEKMDFRAFPTTLSFSLSGPITSEPVNMTFVGSSVNTDEITLTPKFLLTIPPGKGEHQDKDDQNSADGTHGPDWSKNSQEVVYFHFGITDGNPAPCDAHFYAKPGSHGINSTMKLKITDQVISFTFNGISFDSPWIRGENQDWEKDGCDLPIIGSIMGSIATTLIGLGPVTGGVAGAYAGMKADDLVSSKINLGIAQAVEGINISRQWRLK